MNVPIAQLKWTNLGKPARLIMIGNDLFGQNRDSYRRFLPKRGRDAVDADLTALPRARSAGTVMRLVLALLASLALILWPDRADAQSTPVTIGKQLCQGTTCGVAAVVPGAAVYYKITLTNPTGTPQPVTIRDSLPAGFQLVGYGCAAAAGPSTPLTASAAQPLVFAATVPAAGSLECVIAGTFAAASGGVNNVAQLIDSSTQAVLRSSNIVSTYVDPTQPLPTNLTITKSASVPSVDLTYAPQTVTYTFTIANAGSQTVFLGQLLALDDLLSLPGQGVVLNAKFLGATCAVLPASGSGPPPDCLNPIPVFQSPMPLTVFSTTPTPFLRWRYPPGSNGRLGPGDKIVLTVQVELSRVPGVICILAPNSDGVANLGRLILNMPPTGSGPATALADSNTADNAATASVSATTGPTLVDPACNAAFQPPPPSLQIVKIQQSPPVVYPWPSSISYRITVRNTSTNASLRIRRINVGDWVTAGVGTPSFVARLDAHACSAPCTVTYTPPGAMPLAGSGATRQMYGAILVNQSSGGLLPNQFASFTVRIRYSNPGCDSYPGINPKAIPNFGRVLAWDEDVGGTVTHINQIVQSGVTTRMQMVPPCPQTVQKTATTNVIRFANPNLSTSVNYSVTFSNPGAVPRTVGTLVDLMRIIPFPTGAPPYATQIEVRYMFQCFVTQGTVTGFPPSHNPTNWNIPSVAHIVATPLAQQGVPLIHNSQPVVFGPNSSLGCTLFVWVLPPDPNDPYCSSAQLENVAMMDMSPFFDVNAAWPNGNPPGMFASVRGDLPRCLNLVVNKDALTTPWTWQGGGPLTWTLHVTNQGAPITAPGVIVTDTLDPGLTVTSANTACVPAGCGYSWAPSPSAGNPSVLGVNALAHSGAEIRTTITVANAPPSIGPGGEVCNNAIASLAALTQWPTGHSFWKSTNTLHGSACIPILPTAPLTIVKLVDNQTGLLLPPSLTFPVAVACTNSNPNFNGPSTTVTLAAGSSGTIAHVPVGSTCAISETPPAVTVASRNCLWPTWSVAYLPGASVTISGGRNSATVTNTLVCGPPPPATLQFRKWDLVNASLTPRHPLDPTVTPWLPAQSFPVTVTCGANPPVTVILDSSNNYQASISGVAGMTCTFSETPPAFPFGNCHWTALYPQGASVQLMPGLNVRDVHNRQDCP